jgi:thiol-disulfide isomerase/thioredoxin
MILRFALMTMLALAWMVPLPGPVVATGQESPPACASARWLAPLAATPVAGDAARTPVAEAAPAWLTAELTDACSGEPFTLADFAGKTVYVETLATWCPPCRDQLARAKEAAASIPEVERGDVVFVALSSEVGLPRETLAAYAADNNFPFVFAVMPAAMLQAMAGDLGREVAVPSATPHLIIAPDGTVGELRTGGTAPNDLLTLLEEAAHPAAS